jgi:hypothetical protein
MKRILLFFALSFIVFHLNAQNSKHTIGIMGGGSFSTISNYEGDLLLGLTGGIYYEWKLSDRLALQSNILYVQKGEKGKNNISALKLYYINMPIMLKYYITPEFSILSGINSDFLVGVNSNSFDKSDFKNTDWGIPIGLSYLLSDNFELGVIYNLGLTEIDNNAMNANKLKNNFGNITLAYLFN